MKCIIVKILFPVLLFISAINSVHANTIINASDTVPIMSREDYLQKAKTQKTTAIRMLIVGGAIFLGGAILTINITLEAVANIFSTEETRNPGPYIIMAIAGAAVALGSIPVFHASHKNKRRAMAMPTAYLKMENIMMQTMPGISQSFYPAIGIKFRF